MLFEFAEGGALFLDVDGTLVAIASHPDDVRVARSTLELVESLHGALGGALALVSGRSIAALDALFAPLRLPAAGIHGLERRDARGEMRRSRVDAPALAAARERLEDFAGELDGAWVEDKDGAVALHVRQARARTGTGTGTPMDTPTPTATEDPDPVDVSLERFTERLKDGLPDGLGVQKGKKVVEVKSTSASKGRAVEAFMSEPPFEGRRPIFLGDDVTDEDAFRWVNAHGGSSIKVGEGVTTACHRLEDVAAVARWLRAYRDFLDEPARG